MPIYEYTCTKCGKDFEELVFGDDLPACPHCGAAETRKLMNHPEVVGYEVYASLVTATSQMMYYLKEQKKITSANILSIHSFHARLFRRLRRLLRR